MGNACFKYPYQGSKQAADALQNSWNQRKTHQSGERMKNEVRLRHTYKQMWLFPCHTCTFPVHSPTASINPLKEVNSCRILRPTLLSTWLAVISPAACHRTHTHSHTLTAAPFQSVVKKHTATFWELYILHISSAKQIWHFFLWL